MIKCEVLATGSKGNAVIVNDILLIDCGVPFQALKGHYQKLKTVLLTHIHADHFNKSTIKRLARERPTLRFGCGRWLVGSLVDLGVANIDVLKADVFYSYGFFDTILFDLVHDVPNCGYKVHFPNGKLFYATDTENLNGIKAPHYDLYLVEANYGEAEIKERIAEKKAAGEFPYEKRVTKTHLSIEQANDFIYRNAGPNSQYIYLHQHEGGKNEGQADRLNPHP